MAGMSWPHAILITLAVVAFFAVLIITGIAAVEGEDWPGRWWIVGIGCIILILCLAAAVKEAAEGEDDCHDRGGTLIQTGTRPQLVGKVIVQAPTCTCGIIEVPG